MKPTKYPYGSASEIVGFKKFLLNWKNRVVAIIDQSGDFLGVSLTFYLKKIDFKKIIDKKKKKSQE